MFSMKDVLKMPPQARARVLAANPDLKLPEKKPRSVFRSETERKFWDMIHEERPECLILYEPVRLKLTGLGDKAAWYTPDFMVATPHERIIFYEIKGFWREAARVRIKVAAGMYPCFDFTAVQLVKGDWEYEHFLAEAAF